MSPESTEAGDESNPAERDTGEMSLRGVLAERVNTDLSRSEQETGLNFFSADDRFSIHSYSPAIVRDLLRHNEAAIEWLYVAPPNERKRRETNLREVADTDALHIEGVKATLPIAVLKVKGKPRTRGVPSAIVSTPSDAEDVEGVFQ